MTFKSVRHGEVIFEWRSTGIYFSPKSSQLALCNTEVSRNEWAERLLLQYDLIY
jgi:hypothetical protein